MVIDLFQHDLALGVLGVIQGVTSLPTHNWVLRRLAGNTSPWSAGKSQARYFLASVAALVALALVVVGPLYLLGLVPLRGRASTFGYSWLAGIVAWWGLTHIVSWYRSLLRRSERRA
jgi:hypothetical protein